MPLSLNDDEYSAIMQAAAPIHPLQRDAFLKALAVELERHPVVGPWRCASSCRGPAEDVRRRRPQRDGARAATFEGEPAAS
jgi:hypothetical protein